MLKAGQTDRIVNTGICDSLISDSAYATPPDGVSVPLEMIRVRIIERIHDHHLNKCCR